MPFVLPDGGASGLSVIRSVALKLGGGMVREVKEARCGDIGDGGRGRHMACDIERRGVFGWA